MAFEVEKSLTTSLLVILLFIPGTLSTRPNILFLVSDDLRVQLGCYSTAPQLPYSISPPMTTPHLDDLASRSLLLLRAYTQQAVCNPSRTATLTSRRPDTSGVYSSETYFRISGGNFTTIPQYFKEKGYTTLGMGKIFHPGEASGSDDPVSWSEPFYIAPNHKKWKNRKYGTNKAVSVAERQNQALPDTQVADKAIEALQKVADDAKSGKRPFFLAVGFHKPHMPFQYPAELLEHYPESAIRVPDNMYAPVDMPSVAWHLAAGFFAYPDMEPLNATGDYNTTQPLPDFKVRELRRSYYAAVTFMDGSVGRVLDELKAQDLENNTVIVFWGDHGFQLGEHGEWSKQTNFELATRVPLMIHIPGRTDAGLQSQELVELVDVFPTLVEAAGFEPLDTCPEDSSQVPLCTEGRSLMPLVNDHAKPKWKQAAFSQFPRDRTMGYSMKTDQFRYTEWANLTNDEPDWDDLQGIELYDHSLDPLENHNQVNNPSYSEIMQELSEKLHRGWRHA